MKQQYYMGNGKGPNCDRGELLKGVKKLEEGSLLVINELGNGAGWKFEVLDTEVVSISKEDYHYMLDIHCNDWTEESEEKITAKMKEVLELK
ncbi:hypothetical protein [Lysinibacillus fusiformis]|uniref:hypothetical protein n=1 Tax=Lysinibacillus fusiformis TaxID=28031 RepID=UPI0021BF77E0|nr:hypothetical protein [Lysinibacillus fusiformis]UXJ71261.1 hypothetical protein N5069_23780 [Lysinibacillus fusiformis]